MTVDTMLTATESRRNHLLEHLGLTRRDSRRTPRTRPKRENPAKSRWPLSELRRWLETVPTHEGKLSGGIRRLTRPQRLEVLKVGVQGWGVQDQYSGRGGARVRKRVGEPFGHQHKPPRPAPHLVRTEHKLDLALEHEERFKCARVRVRRWSPPTGWKVTFHERKGAVRYRCNGLEDHPAAPRLEDFAFTRPERY